MHEDLTSGGARRNLPAFLKPSSSTFHPEARIPCRMPEAEGSGLASLGSFRVFLWCCYFMKDSYIGVEMHTLKNASVTVTGK